MAVDFISHKINFFASFDPNKVRSVEDADAINNFVLVSRNHESIELELNQLFECLKKNGIDRPEFWEFCYEMSDMLRRYYEAYQPSLAKKYVKRCEEISLRAKNQLPVEKKLSTCEQIGQDLGQLAEIPFSPSIIRDLDGKANMLRLSTRFSMITLKQVLLLVDYHGLLTQFEKLTGLSVNIAVLDAPLGIYNALSVGLFGLRFVIDVGFILQHAFNPSVTENNAITDWTERAYNEFKKRHITMANDVVWTIVNSLSNYGNYFHVAPVVGNCLTVTACFFDMIWLHYALHVTATKFHTKRVEYQQYKATLVENSPEWLMVLGQLKQLEFDDEKAQATIKFYIYAVYLMITGFATAVLLAPPALAPVCFLMCNVAMAMYFSGEQYGGYQEKHSVAEQLPEGEARDIAIKESQIAWNSLWLTVAKNTAAPLIIIAAFTLSVPAAILLTLAYAAYELGYLTQLMPEENVVVGAPLPGG